MKHLAFTFGFGLMLATLLAAQLRAAEEKIWHIKALPPAPETLK